jgi:hypothetical protein
MRWLVTALLGTLCFILCAVAQDIPVLPAKPVDLTTPPAPAALVYAGKAVAVPFTCDNALLESLEVECSPRRPCPVYLELSSMESIGTRILLTGNLHTTAQTLQSILLMSEDSGKTWTEPIERARAGVLEHVQFFDFANGWVTGQTVQGLARDPFVLVTRDGGRTWRKVMLWNESKIGSIDALRFTSAEKGKLVVDRRGAGEDQRWELYESSSGGAAWNVLELSTRKFSLMQPGEAATGAGEERSTRLRADAATKAYRVETRKGREWRTLAAFAIQLPACKPVD